MPSKTRPKDDLLSRLQSLFLEVKILTEKQINDPGDQTLKRVIEEKTKALEMLSGMVYAEVLIFLGETKPTKENFSGLSRLSLLIIGAVAYFQRRNRRSKINRRSIEAHIRNLDLLELDTFTYGIIGRRLRELTEMGFLSRRRTPKGIFEYYLLPRGHALLSQTQKKQSPQQRRNHG